MSRYTPSSRPSTRVTSAWSSTTGIRVGPRPLGTTPASASGRPSTSLYRNTSAAWACTCVADATRRSSASQVRKAATSRSPISRG